MRGGALFLAFLLSAAATPGGAADQEVPEHLESALDDLARPDLTVLVPQTRPGGTTGTVTDATRRFYRLLFTNDPQGRLSHAEQINVSVTGSRDPQPAPPEATPVRVRDTEGFFSCGASACFLDWEEAGASYSVGEFGNPDDAVEFAESLTALEEALSPAPPSPPGPGDEAAGSESETDDFPWESVAVVTGAAALLLGGGGLLLRARRRP
jgi:hypothetical protein